MAGPYLVKASIGEEVDAETLGGASTHCEISGVTDNKYPDDPSCLDAIKRIFDKVGHNETAGFDRIAPTPPVKNPDEIFDILPSDRNKPYDMREIIERIVDNSEFEEYKKLYGQTILCGYARVEGWAVGIVANQRKIVKAKKEAAQPTKCKWAASFIQIQPTKPLGLS